MAKTAAEWDALLKDADCCFALVNPPAAVPDDPHIRAVLLEVAREEKTHVGEFQTMLLRLDKEQVEELTGKK